MSTEKSALAIDLVSVENIPLAVHLDGTLIKTDILWESLLALLKQNTRFIFLIPFWLLKGKAYLKQEMARRIHLDVSRLPYNQQLLKFLRGERQRGRILILTSASDRTIVQKVADYLGIFAEVLSSRGHRNLKGAEKARALEEKFGKRGFDYAGNGRADLKVWACSHAAASSVVLCR